MPRSAGTYTLPANSLAVSGTTISSTYFNAALNDIASEMTASVPRDGTGAMSAGLQGYSGTASAPSYTYSADATSGTFRKADNQIGMSIDGSEVGYWDLNGWNPTSATASQLAGTRNVLINGGMQVSQRNGTAGTTTADDAYALDRWYALTQTGTITVTQQSLGEDGTPYHARLTQAQASAQRMGMAQIVEAANSYPYRGKGMTLGARIRCSSAQAIRYAVLEWTGTADTVTSDVVNSWTNATFTAGNFFNSTTLTVTAVGTITPVANTWTTITALNATISSSVTNLIVMIWTEATAAQNVTLDIARVQLEPGAVATPFEWRGYSTELALCERYYRVLSAGLRGDAYTVVIGATLGFSVSFEKMRDTPTAAATWSTSTNLTNGPFIVAGPDFCHFSGNTSNGGATIGTLSAVTLVAEL